MVQQCPNPALEARNPACLANEKLSDRLDGKHVGHSSRPRLGHPCPSVLRGSLGNHLTLPSPPSVNSFFFFF